MITKELYSIRRILVVFAVLIFTLGCGISSFPSKNNVASPSPFVSTLPTKEKTTQPITSSDEENKVITITEEQMTDFIQQRMSKMEKPVLTNPRVKLSENTIQMTGQISSGTEPVDIKIIFKLIVDENGKSKLKLDKADMGGIEIPSEMGDIFSEMISIEEMMATYGVDYKIESIKISDGVMTITRATP